MQPAAKEIGQALQTAAKTIHVLMAPVSMLVWGFDQIKDFVVTRVAEKLNGIPEELLVSPEPNIAGPALESLRYAGHKEELRELYASLLATSMHKENKEQAHPAFVEIIRQLSPDEAKIIRNLSLRGGGCALVDVRSRDKAPPGGGYWVLKNFTLIPYDAECTIPEQGPVYMVNLQRLGLIEIREGYHLHPRNGVDLYQPLLDHHVIKLTSEKIVQDAEREPEIKKGAVFLTPFGLQFCKACIYHTQNRRAD